MSKSFNATAVASALAIPVTVVIAMPVLNVIPFVNSTFAPADGGIIRENNTDAPAVGAPAVLWNATLRAAAFEL